MEKRTMQDSLPDSAPEEDWFVYRNEHNDRYALTTASHIQVDSSVTAIPAKAFQECPALQVVVISPSVEIIGDHAFHGCVQLAQVHWAHPDKAGLKCIGAHAFHGCTRLQAMELPDSLQEIGEGAFESCSKFKAMLIPPSVSEIPPSCFRQCAALIVVDLPDNLRRISDDAFAHCSSLQIAVLPPNLESIGNRAFAHCGLLQRLDMPETLSHIGQGAFQGCPANAQILELQFLQSLQSFWSPPTERTNGETSSSTQQEQSLVAEDPAFQKLSPIHFLMQLLFAMLQQWMQQCSLAENASTNALSHQEEEDSEEMAVMEEIPEIHQQDTASVQATEELLIRETKTEERSVENESVDSQIPSAVDVYSHSSIPLEIVSSTVEPTTSGEANNGQSETAISGQEGVTSVEDDQDLASDITLKAYSGTSGAASFVVENDEITLDVTQQAPSIASVTVATVEADQNTAQSDPNTKTNEESDKTTPDVPITSVAKVEAEELLAQSSPNTRTKGTSLVSFEQPDASATDLEPSTEDDTTDNVKLEQSIQPNEEPHDDAHDDPPVSPAVNGPREESHALENSIDSTDENEDEDDDVMPEVWFWKGTVATDLKSISNVSIPLNEDGADHLNESCEDEGEDEQDWGRGDLKADEGLLSNEKLVGTTPSTVGTNESTPLTPQGEGLAFRLYDNEIAEKAIDSEYPIADLNQPDEGEKMQGKQNCDCTCIIQ